MDKWKVPTTKVKLLPATPLGLVKRFRKNAFSRENILIQRNELVSILDEMYRQQNVIGPIEYRQINNKLAQSIGSGFEESLVDAENQSNGENMVIDESTDEELVKLIDELKEILTSNTLLELEKAVCEFLI